MIFAGRIRSLHRVQFAGGRRGVGSLGLQLEVAAPVTGRLAGAPRRVAAGGNRAGPLDTGDGPIEQIFSRLDDKDPRRVLDRFRSDANNLYSTYGDDSSYFDDTPTAGRVYLRAENENFRITWGDFTAGMNSASLLHNTRDLYGAEVRYQSSATTSGGEAKLAANLYAAQPDTLAQRDILRFLRCYTEMPLKQVLRDRAFWSRVCARTRQLYRRDFNRQPVLPLS